MPLVDTAFNIRFPDMSSKNMKLRLSTLSWNRHDGVLRMFFDVVEYNADGTEKDIWAHNTPLDVPFEKIPPSLNLDKVLLDFARMAAKDKGLTIPGGE